MSRGAFLTSWSQASVAQLKCRVVHSVHCNTIHSSIHSRSLKWIFVYCTTLYSTQRDICAISSISLYTPFVLREMLASISGRGALISWRYSIFIWVILSQPRLENEGRYAGPSVLLAGCRCFLPCTQFDHSDWKITRDSSSSTPPFEELSPI